MKKILVFGITDNPGGVESVIMTYYRKLDKTKYQFDFLCNTEKVAHEKEIISLGGTIYRICARSKNRKQYKKDMQEFFERHSKEYIAIWVNVCSLANIDYLKYAKKYGIPKRIIHSHNSQNMDSKLRGILHTVHKNQIEKYATDFWACSYDAAKWFYKDKIAKDALILHNAIDVDKMFFDAKKRESIRTKYNLNGFTVIGNVGRLHFQKNQEFIVDIFCELKKRNDAYKLVLVGQGEDENKLREKVNKLGLNKDVLFVGVQKDIQAWLSSFDLFLFPSRFEGLSIAGLEAQANGISVLSSKGVNPNELKVNDNFWFCSLNHNAIYWANQVEKMLTLNRLTNEKILSNFQTAGYDINTEINKFERILDTL